MKKLTLILLPICAVIFIAIRLLPALVSKQKKMVVEAKPKLMLPKPVAVSETAQVKAWIGLLPIQKKNEAAREYFNALLAHPWIHRQPEVEEISQEMIRDIELLHTWHQALSKSALKSGRNPLSEKEMTDFFINTLSALQEKLPFHFPAKYYNVLNISETAVEAYPTPIPFQVHKRLYLGETELGLPFYLDVRVFNLDQANDTLYQQVIDWHFGLIGEGKDAFKELGHSAYLGKGMCNQNRPDPTHGFSALQGERGVFLQFIEKQNCLFIAYASAPWHTFSKYLQLFQDLSYDP